MQTLTWHFNTGGEQIKEQSTDKNALQNCIMTEIQGRKQGHVEAVLKVADKTIELALTNIRYGDGGKNYDTFGTLKRLWLRLK